PIVGPDGAFAIDGLRHGDAVDLVASCPGYDDARANAVVAGEAAVVLQPTPRLRPIAGRVLDAAGNPAKLTWVRLTPRQGGFVRRALTDFDGAFEASDALDLEYEVR